MGEIKGLTKQMKRIADAIEEIAYGEKGGLTLSERLQDFAVDSGDINENIEKMKKTLFRIERIYESRG